MSALEGQGHGEDQREGWGAAGLWVPAQQDPGRKQDRSPAGPEGQAAGQWVPGGRVGGDGERPLQAVKPGPRKHMTFARSQGVTLGPPP